MYNIDPVTKDLVVNGFQNGIGASPYTGLTDMKSVNPNSIAGEASVAFSTGSVTKAPAITGGSGSVATGTNAFLAPNHYLVEEGQWVTFTNIVTGGTGLTVGNIYWLQQNGNSGANQGFSLYDPTAAYPPSGSAKVIGANSNVTFNTISPSLPKYAKSSSAYNFMIDSNGRVWSDRYLTNGSSQFPSTNSWVWLGNTTDTTSNGNGLEVYKTIYNGTGATGNPATYDEWLFVFKNSSIDYTQLLSNNSNSTITWKYNWEPSLGTLANVYAPYLQTGQNVPNPHASIVTLPNMVVYTDAFYTSAFFQNIPALSSSNYTGFNPLDNTTYYFNIFPILDPTDTAQCLSFVNQYVLIGGKQNYIYPWNAANLDNKYTAPIIILPENNTSNIITVGNNAYIFTGNRGNIYITNGSQASFLTKVPDHISSSVEPLYNWGGATYNKNRLYFGINANYQAGGTASGYGGVWCMDVTNGQMWNIGQMSYGSYAGYVSAIANTVAETAGGNTYGPNYGYGLMMGWTDGSSNYGMDVSVANPYTNGASWVTTELIPVGTTIDPTTPSQIEFKLSTPLVTGESIQIKVGSYLDPTYASFKSCTFSGASSFSTAGAFSGITDGMPLDKFQWITVQVILTSTTSSPSYCRLTELRIKNAGRPITGYSAIQ